MEKINYKNEIAKRTFYAYLGGSRQYSFNSIKCFKPAIWDWQEFSKNKDFVCFSKTMATDFKEWLKNKNKKNSAAKISLSACNDILRYLREFFSWLSQQPGYKRISKTDIGYLKLSKKEVRMATQQKRKEYPTLDEIKTLIESIRVNTDVGKRDKALISLTFLTGIRIAALASLRIQNFDREKLIIDQDPNRDVKTKNSKRIITTFVPLPYKEPLGYFLDWFDYLISEKKFKPTDPLFPATMVKNIDGNNICYHSTNTVKPVFWKSSTTLREIFEDRSRLAGVKYYHPHTYRHLIVNEVGKLPLSEIERKAISKNFGHEDVGTTFGNYGYGDISEQQQMDAIKNLDFSGKKIEVKYQVSEAEMAALADKINKNKMYAIYTPKI